MTSPLRTLSQLLARNRRLTFAAAAVGAVVLTLTLPAAALAATPGVDTFDTVSTSATAATVEGEVNPQGQSTTYAVQWALGSDDWCTSFGSTGTPTTTTSTPLSFTDDNFHGVSVGLTGLTANTAYCAQLIATNGDGQAVGGQVFWTQGLPVPETFDAFSTAQTTATVEGDVNPSGQSTTYAAQYDVGTSDWCQSGGVTGSPANTTTPVALGPSDTTFHSVSVNLTGLTGGTQYCAQLIATNGSGTGNGGEVTWTQGVPSAFTLDASSTGATTATVDAEVNPAGQTTTYKVQYDTAASTWCTSGGATGSPGNTTTPATLGFTDTSLHDVQVNLTTGLSPGVEYCAQLVANNASGEGDGGQVTWTEGAPSADTNDAFSTGATTATVEGDVNPSAQTTTYQVNYDLQSSTWCQSGTGSPAHTTTPAATLGFTDTSFHAVSVDLTGLTAGTEYCAQIIATNASGEGDGLTVTWTQGLPQVFTDDANSTGATTATVDGEINPAGQSTTYVVQYDVNSSTWCQSGGTTGSPAHTTGSTPLGFTDTTFHNVSTDLTGLTAGAQYCAQVVATNGAGSADGGTVTWTEGTPSADTLDAVSTGLTTATIDGDVNPSAQTTTYQVAYSLASTDWCTSGGSTGSPGSFTTPTPLGFTDTGFHDVSVNITGLAAGTSYCAAVVATNAAGTVTGGQVQWTQGAPSADTTAAGGTSTTTATVSGDVNPSGQTTTYQAWYGLDSTQWCQTGGFLGSPTTKTTATPLGFTDGTHTVSVDITGLTANTAYCAEIVATNADGSGEGGTLDWTQPSVTPKHTLTVSRVGTGVGTVTSSPAAINCGSTCAALFDGGTQVTLTAAASAGSTFAGWSGGGCSGTGTCQVTLNADTTVTATFNTTAPVTHTLTVTPAGTGSGSVTSGPAGISCGATCSHAFNAGTQITLTATADSGSTFTGWSGGGCSGTGTCQVTLNADTTVTATFTGNSPPPPPVKCIVPKVKGKKLAAAKTAIKKAHCSVGKITKVKSSSKNRGKVISQSPKPGKHLPKGSKVSLKVGK